MSPRHQTAEMLASFRACCFSALCRHAFQIAPQTRLIFTFSHAKQIFSPPFFISAVLLPRSLYRV